MRMRVILSEAKDPRCGGRPLRPRAGILRCAQDDEFFARAPDDEFFARAQGDDLATVSVGGRIRVVSRRTVSTGGRRGGSAKMFEPGGRREVSRGARGSVPGDPGTTTVVGGGPVRVLS